MREFHEVSRKVFQGVVENQLLNIKEGAGKTLYISLENYCVAFLIKGKSRSQDECFVHPDALGV